MKITSDIAAVVTGGASGLGLASATALAQAGARVAIFDRNRAQGEAAAASIGGVFCEVDVTSDAQVDAAFEKARAAHGQERILVNCAGTGNAGKTVSRDRKSGEIKRYSAASFDQTLQINLVGTFRCITAAAAGMLTLAPLDDEERGVIINTSSIAAEEGQIGQVAYSASKAGICGMTLTIARDLAADAIRINTILPGLFATPPLLAAPKEMFEALSAGVPYPRRLGKPEEFASLVSELVRNSYFNGQTIRLDGALRMPPR